MTTLFMAVTLGFPAALLISAYVAPAGSGGEPRGSLSDLVLRLETDRTRYLVGEPVRLTLKVQNTGTDRGWGYFQLLGGYEETDLYYRRDSGPFIRIDEPTKPLPAGLDIERFPSILKPGEQREYSTLLASNPSTGTPLLDTPGEYEFKVVCRPQASVGAEIEPSPVRVRVDPVSGDERDALDQYTREKLASFVEVPAGYARRDRGVLKRAAAFLKAHEHSVYGEHVRGALTSALNHLILRNEATAGETELYQSLRPPPQHVTLTLAADRASYYVGEPIRFSLAVRNHGAENVSGRFLMNGEESDIYYRKGDGAFVKLAAPPHPPRPEPDRILLPMLLRPEENRQSQRVLTLNPVTSGLLLDEPGDYDFKVFCHPRWPFYEEPVLETNVVRVRVEPPPAGQHEAFFEYRRDNLAPLVQVPYGYAVYEPAVLKRAADFLDRHPQGPYREQVRRALKEALRFKVVRNEATKDERGLYERLREGSPPEK